ncbi:MAG TPA: asparagine synthase (glutamine-hydrolyzing) [Clostridiaceae bacterium]|nr:asparagine synthase (glutamine-hydrolyzing) [Clostridiaceae bacterium]
MCGLVGFANPFKDVSSFRNVLNNMNNEIAKRGPDEDGMYFEENVCLGHKRLIVIDPDGGKQPMIFRDQGNTYSLVYNGQIYNTKELKDELSENGFTFDGHSDTEVLLKGFSFWKYDIIHKLNGIFSFAIWNSKEKELFVARDHFGVKPFYYSIVDGTFVFASEVKALFKYPGITAKIDSEGISELFGLGPSHTPGHGIFKDIHELKPASYGVFNSSGLHVEKYWSLVSLPHKDSFGTTCDKVRFLLEDSIRRQLVSDVPLCTFLSGGLDSSIITLYAANYCKEKGLPPLNTYSVDYVDNDKNFVKTDFQPNSDNYYINLMKNKLNTNHHSIILDTPELADSLEDAMLARDYPGMADVDSSLLLFCKNVKKHATVTLTGECSDEIFGGYPWFFRDDALNSGTFPWSIALDERQTLLNPEIAKKVHLKDYVNFRYTESLNEVNILDTDSKETQEKRKISHLTLNWFMQTLLDRSDRMAMYNGFEIRVPFCDYRLAQYVWNIPWEIKALNGREKGLLRYVMKDLLPSEIVDRKKSPYPKTWNPTYLQKVKGMLTDIMENKNAPINSLLNRQYILDIIKTDGRAFTRPWFGQLMTGPQLMAYLCQVNMWLERYQPKIEI